MAVAVRLDNLRDFDQSKTLRGRGEVRRHCVAGDCDSGWTTLRLVGAGPSAGADNNFSG